MLPQYKADKTLTLLFIVVMTIPTICCIRITDNVAASSSKPLVETTTKTYRISLPRSQRPSNRVPSHLQDIRTAGYVDDDADDVIHIIEPPTYFQQLKRQAHRQQAFQVAQPQLTIDTPKKSTMDLLTQETQDIARSVKTAQQKHKIATILPMHLVKLQQQQQHSQQQQPQNAVPFELLASVRHKDRIFQRSRPLTLPFARERIKVKNIQTVLMEQGFEQQQYDRGQQLAYGVQRRTGGKFGLRNRKRLRRSADNLTNEHSERESEGSKFNISFEKSSTSSGNTTEQKTKGIQLPNGYLRRKREVPKNNLITRKIRRSNRNKVGIEGKLSPTKDSNDSNKRKVELTQKYALLKGNDLIDHITELLRNATQFTSEGLKVIRLPNNNQVATKTPNQHGQKFQQDQRATAFNGEIKTTVDADVKLKDDQVHKIIEQSINTTDAIMVALLNYTKLTPEQCPENYTNNIEPNKRIQLLQTRINCIRQQIGNNTKLLPTRKPTNRENSPFGQRSTTAATATVAVNRLRRKQKDNKLTTKPSTFLRANLQDQPDNESARSIASNISGNLLYDDIMTNIRNLLQIKNLEELNDELDGNQKRDTSSVNFSLELPTRSIEDVTTSTNFGEFNHLNEYLNELQKIVSDFIVTPSSKSESVSSASSTTELTLNSREHSSSMATTTESLKNWYLINNNGQIYQTNLANELRPTVAVFHRFPDIPKAEIYFQNRTLLTDKTKAYEIL